MLSAGILALAALVVGALIGAVGVGGILLIPALVAFADLPIHAASATALLTFILTGVVSTWLFARRGSIDWPASLTVCAGALAFSFLGAYVNSRTDAVVLDRIVGGAIVFAGANVLLSPRWSAAAGHDSLRWRALLAVGAVAGFGSGLTGAGGPLFSVPLMLALGFAPLMAIGVSQVLQIASASAGTAANLAFGTIAFGTAAWILPFELAGVAVGVAIAHRADVRRLRMVAAWLCIVSGAFILLRSG
ncbi:MAG: sulfite exporter TauE/SafE family protein [Casimicrobiaceae bacterium]